MTTEPPGGSERPEHEEPDGTAADDADAVTDAAGTAGTPGFGRRELALAVGLVALGAAVALLGGGRSSGVSPGVPSAPGAGSRDAGSASLALVALAGAGAVLLLRNRARTVLGVALVGVAAALVAVGTTPTRWTALVGAVLVGLGGLLVVLRASRWPQPRGRYEPRPPRASGTPRDTWDALDRGEDPTA